MALRISSSASTPINLAQYPHTVSTRIPMAVSTRFFQMPNNPFHNLLRFCSTDHTNNITHESAGPEYSPAENQGKGQKLQVFSSKEIFKSLKRYGISGILSYGLLNTAYYLTTFLVVWFYVTPAPGKMGYLAAVERFLKVMAMVWAGSQVTKLIRAGGALALAPFVDRGLSWFTVKFKFESQGKAFAAIAGLCFGLALVVFLVITLLSA